MQTLDSPSNRLHIVARNANRALAPKKRQHCRHRRSSDLETYGDLASARSMNNPHQRSDDELARLGHRALRSPSRRISIAASGTGEGSAFAPVFTNPSALLISRICRLRHDKHKNIGRQQRRQPRNTLAAICGKLDLNTRTKVLKAEIAPTGLNALLRAGPGSQRRPKGHEPQASTSALCRDFAA